jgi:cytidine deaminase
MNKTQLIAEALKARNLSQSPYSHFAVGAALTCTDGKVYRGANIENASYPLSMCAERTAIYNAYLDGKKKEDFVALAVVADAPRAVSPCGACRQVMAELLGPNVPVIMANLHGDVKESTVAELLPYAFKESDL